MPRNKVPRLREPHTRDCVLQVRDLFLEHYKTDDPELYYEEDVQLVREMKFLLQRCLISKRKSVPDSLAMLVQMLKWRKEMHIRELTDQDFPIEYFTAAIAFIYEPDKWANRTLFIRTRLLRCVPELRASFKRYIAYLMYQIDDCEHGETFSIVFDLTKTGWQNYDIDLLMHFLTLLKDYFPVNVDYILAINFPWILTTAWSFVKRLIPPERRDVVVFIEAKEVSQFIETHQLPDFLGGQCAREYQTRPKTPLTLTDYLLERAHLEAGAGGELSAKRIGEILCQLGDILSEEQISENQRRLKASGRK